MDDGSGGITRRTLLAGGAGLAIASAAPAARPAPKQGRHEQRDARAALIADPAAAVGDGRMWEQFCDALKPLGRHVAAEHAPGDPVTQVEGIRCLTRLVALGLDRFLEYADPRHPAFYDLQTPTRKYLGDNPDQSYRVASVDGSGRYRIRGTVAGAAGVEIGVHAGTFRSDGGDGSDDSNGAGGGRRLVASTDETTLPIADDGRFELTLGPEEGGAGHLRTAGDAGSVLVRTYFWDRDLRLAHPMPTIERLDVSEPPAPLDPAVLLRGLLGAVAFVDGSLGWWNGFEGIGSEPNELVVMPDDGTVQTPSRVRYINGVVELEPDQAFVLEFTPRDEPGYWSWVLQNLWGETPDWRYRPVVRNNRELERGEDGAVRIVVSQRHPGLAGSSSRASLGSNWMDMAGHRRLLLSLRWRGESPLPEVATQVVAVDELAALG